MNKEEINKIKEKIKEDIERIKKKHNMKEYQAKYYKKNKEEIKQKVKARIQKIKEENPQEYKRIRNRQKKLARKRLFEKPELLIKQKEYDLQRQERAKIGKFLQVNYSELYETIKNQIMGAK